MNIKIRSRYDDRNILFEGDYPSVKAGLVVAVKSTANLHSANLSDANLHGANLRGANLRGADLGGANLRGLKNYCELHDVFIAVVAMQEPSSFTACEWAAIGQISILQICWDTIAKRHKNAALSVFIKLDKAGYGEWLTKFESVIA